MVRRSSTSLSQPMSSRTNPRRLACSRKARYSGVLCASVMVRTCSSVGGSSPAPMPPCEDAGSPPLKTPASGSEPGSRIPVGA